jgi:hypothetical protein
VPGTGCVDTHEFQYVYDFRCLRLCPRGSHGFCGPNKQCGGNIFGGDYCVWQCAPIRRHCDIYAQDCADQADECSWAENVETDERYTGCYHEGMTSEGQPCGGLSPAECARGLVCAYIGSQYRCARVCRATGTASCPTGETCSGVRAGWDFNFCQ